MILAENFEIKIDLDQRVAVTASSVSRIQSYYVLNHQNTFQVSLACGNGYTEAVGDTGYKTLQCKQKVSTGGSGLDVEWSVDENNRLTCVRE